MLHAPVRPSSGVGPGVAAAEGTPTPTPIAPAASATTIFLMVPSPSVVSGAPAPRRDRIRGIRLGSMRAWLHEADYVVQGCRFEAKATARPPPTRPARNECPFQANAA